MKCSLLGIQCPRRRFALLNYILIACCILLTVSILSYQWIDKENLWEAIRGHEGRLVVLEKPAKAQAEKLNKKNWPNQGYGEGK